MKNVFNKLVVVGAVVLLISICASAAIKFGTDPTGQKWFGQTGDQITTSTGKAYALTNSGLQSAIYSLNMSSTGLDFYNGKTVLVGGDITITSTIRFNSNVVVDFQNHVVTVAANIDLFNLSDVGHCTIKNLVINISSATYTSNLITLYATGTDRCDFNSFENIRMNSNGINAGAKYNYNGIKLYLASNSNQIMQNTFRDITLWYVDKGIWLKASGTGGTAYQNTFEDILIWQWIDGMIYFDVDRAVTHAFYRNSFYNVKGESYTGSLNGVYNVSEIGNVFFDCHVWDWNIATSGDASWSFAGNGSVKAEDTIVINCFKEAIDKIRDNGTNTLIVSSALGFRNVNFNNSFFLPFLITDDYTLHLSFDEGYGNIVYDSSNFSNHGNFSHANWTDGKTGDNNALVLRGSGSHDCVWVLDDATLDLSGDFTIECWLKYPLTGVTNNAGFLSKGGDSGATAKTWYIAPGGTSTDRFYYYDSTAGGGAWNIDGDLGEADIPDGWHHFVVTRTSTIYRYYRDGILRDTETGLAVDLSNTYNLFVGKSKGPEYVGCSIDDLKIYKRALSYDEIRLQSFRGLSSDIPDVFSTRVPNRPVAGSCYFNATTGLLGIYTGSVWKWK